MDQMHEIMDSKGSYKLNKFCRDSKKLHKVFIEQGGWCQGLSIYHLLYYYRSDRLDKKVIKSKMDDKYEDIINDIASDPFEILEGVFDSIREFNNRRNITNYYADFVSIRADIGLNSYINGNVTIELFTKIFNDLIKSGTLHEEGITLTSRIWEDAKKDIIRNNEKELFKLKKNGDQKLSQLRKDLMLFTAFASNRIKTGLNWNQFKKFWLNDKDETTTGNDKWKDKRDEFRFTRHGYDNRNGGFGYRGRGRGYRGRGYGFRYDNYRGGGYRGRGYRSRGYSNRGAGYDTRGRGFRSSYGGRGYDSRYNQHWVNDNDPYRIGLTKQEFDKARTWSRGNCILFNINGSCPYKQCKFVHGCRGCSSSDHSWENCDTNISPENNMNDIKRKVKDWVNKN